jgi:hypothetical protein
VAVSGTVGQTVITVTDLIEHAARRCGVLPSTLSGEVQLAARQSLYILTADLANRGLSLWCVGKQVLGMNANQTVFDLPVGTVDVLDALYRTQTNLTGSTISGLGWQGLDLGSGEDAVVNNVAVQLTAGATATLTLESSADNVTWTQQAATFPATLTVAANTWISFDANNAPEARYWRLKNTAALPAIGELTFSNQPYEVNMAVMNRDDYVAFPNKTFTQEGSRSLQYWFDKQITPRLWIWPAAGQNTDQLVIWTHRQIQDVGAFTDTLEVPARWLESIIWTLACRLAIELPKGQIDMDRLTYLEGKSAEHLERAEDGESDGSPIRLLPNIRGYSR